MRQSSADIDSAILDVAAGIFATYGYAHSSLQQIADAVGYSKPGLLHRFGSKAALHRAVLGEVSETVLEILSDAGSPGEQPDDAVQVLTVVARKSLARPGMAQMLIQEAGPRLADILGPASRGPAQRLRAVLALELIVGAARTQRLPLDSDLDVGPEQLEPLVVALAGQVLGLIDAPPS